MALRRPASVGDSGLWGSNRTVLEYSPHAMRAVMYRCMMSCDRCHYSGHALGLPVCCTPYPQSPARRRRESYITSSIQLYLR